MKDAHNVDQIDQRVNLQTNISGSSSGPILSGDFIYHERITQNISFPVPHQIPPAPRDFKDRHEELEDIINDIEDDVPIIALRGMGGIGKTGLALVLAEELKDRFSDGQLFLDMRGTSNNPLKPSEAMAQVIRAYHPNGQMPEDLNELRGLYLSVLSGKRIMLLMDNVSKREQVQLLLPPAGCTTLITSRQRFQLPGMKVKDLDVLSTVDARALLLENAARIGDHADELAELCGYLPLALRNAASVIAEREDIDLSNI